MLVLVKQGNRGELFFPGAGASPGSLVHQTDQIDYFENVLILEWLVTQSVKKCMTSKIDYLKIAYLILNEMNYSPTFPCS